MHEVMYMVLGDLTTKFNQAVLDEIDFFLVLIGSGSSQKILELVKQYLPVEGFADLGDDALMAIIGYLAWNYGDRLHPRLVPLGLGMFIAGAGSFIGEFVNNVIDQLIAQGGEE